MEIINFEDLEKQREQKEPNILTFRKQLEWIAYNYQISKHAEMQMIRRDETDNDKLKNRILSSPLSWKTKENCIAIAFDLYNYIIIGILEDENGMTPVVKTFINTRATKSNVIDAFIMDYKAKCRELGV